MVFKAVLVKPRTLLELAVPKLMVSPVVVVVGFKLTVPLAPAVVLPASSIWSA